MKNVTAHAVRDGKTIVVTIAGSLENTCHTARIQDIYPGGSRVYLHDPGAAQVFIEESYKPGIEWCAMMLIPWGTTIAIPDKNHQTVEILLNNSEVLEIQVVEDRKKSQFIVTSITGSVFGCSIVPEKATYLAIYSQVFGPASYDVCNSWILNNCGAQRPIYPD